MAGDPSELAGLVKAKAHALGFELVGICPADPAQSSPFFEKWLAEGFHGTMEFLPRSAALRSEPRHVLASARSVVMVGLNYYVPVQHAPGQPKIARYALGRDYHRVLRGKLSALGAALQEAEPSVEVRPCVDTAPLFEREFAVRAGIGWIGKNSCLINTRRGSWMFLGALLTSACLEYDTPDPGGCGACRVCIDACPTGAIVQLDGRWTVDSRRCISYLTIEHRDGVDPALEPALAEWTYGCDICQEVCPFNSPREHHPLRAAATQEPDFLKRRAWPSLAEIAIWSHEEWDQATRGSATRRASHVQWKRNAALNLRQSGKSDHNG